MNPFVNDLLYAKQIGKAVEVQLLSGQQYPYAGVKDVSETDNWVALFNPQVFGDDTTFRRIPLDLVASVTVTDVDYGTSWDWRERSRSTHYAPDRGVSREASPVRD